MDATISDSLVGRMLDSRYRIESRLARGGMATVYRAVDLRLDRTVAIKVMHSTLVEDEEFVSRFHREARAAARLSHPNAVAVFDQGSDDEHVFLAMEYVEGRTLRDMLADRGRLTPREAFRIVEPVLAALGAAHQAGLVHRDVKPENVLLAEDGRVKVADFGLARAVSSVSSVTRSTGVLIGTVAYLSPEQVERGVADARSDVYSAGILLFEMLTGAPPHEGDTPLAVAYQHVHADVPPPSSRVEGLPVAVDALVAAATNRDPDLRPTDGRAFHQLTVHARTNLPADELDAGGPDATVIGSSARHTLIVPVGGHRAHGEPPDGEQHDGVGRPGAAGLGTDAPEPNAAGDGNGSVAAASLVGGSDEVEPETAGPGWRDRFSRGRGRLTLLLALLLAVLVGVGAWWTLSGRFIDTPKVVGLQKGAAVERLRDAGLDVFMADEAFSETVPVGNVVSTSPAPGDQVSRSGEVTVVVSKGKERYDVPTLAGAPLDKAESTLRATNLDVGGVVSRYSLKVDKDHVIRSFPGPGTQVRRDADIRLLVSKGPRPVELPDLTGQDADTAAGTLDGSGLDVTTSTAHSDEVAAGLVMGQEPAAGEVVPRGSTVHLVVSKGPPIVTVPDVAGANVDVATQTLEQAGFVVDVQEFPGGPRTVLRQSPAGGESHPRGTTVTLFVF